MKLGLLSTTTLIVLTGCASTPIEFVQKSPKKQAVVRYIAPSKSSQTNYKTELNTQAIKFCNGEYKIKNQQQAVSDVSTPSEIANNAGHLTLRETDNRLAMYDYVEFDCKQ